MNKVYQCFPGGKFKALTMSYDDGREQDRRLISIFNKYGVKGTFHLNSALFYDRFNRIKPEEIPELYKGHEISCHTAHHPTIARCPLTNVLEEVLSDRRELEKLAGYPVRGLSYPNGSVTCDIEALLPMCGIRYSRAVETTGTFALPENPYRWQGTCHHNNRLMELGEQFVGLFKHQYLYLMYVWGHSYEFDDRNNWDLMEDFCRLVGGRDDIWYCTNIEFMDAMDDFRNLQFSADNTFVFNPNCRDCWIRVNDAEPIRIPAGKQISL